MGGAQLPPLDWHAFWTQWELRPVWLGVIGLLTLLYLVGVAQPQVRAVVPPIRVVTFVLGALLLAWTVSSVVQVYAESVFWMHMVQHLLLITIVPALLVLGHPLTVFARTVRGGDRLLHSTPVAVLTHPVVGLAFYTAVVVATHLTGFMNRMVASPWLVWGEQLLYLAAGFVFLLPALGDEPIRWRLPGLMRMGVLILGMIPDTVVGIVLLQSPTNPFPAMLTGHDAWAPDPVHDVQLAGGLMWVGGDSLMMVLAVGVMLGVLASPQTQGSPVGSWLEGVRRSTMLAHVGADDDGSPEMDRDVDVDDDDAMLDAYNAMLRRMNRS